MHVWTYIYLGILVITSVFRAGQNIRFGKYYIPGESLELLIIILFFLWHYELIDSPSNVLIPALGIIYIAYWEWLENIHWHVFYSVPEREPGLSIWRKKKIKQLQIMVPLYILFYAPLYYIAFSVLSEYGT